MTVDPVKATTAGAELLTVRDLEYTYPGAGHTPVLRISDFGMARGERLFLHGPSGSGKTTLLGLLAGILPVTIGSVRLLGQELRGLGGHARDSLRGAHLGYIFQMFNLIPYLNVRDNILLPLRLSAGRRARLGDQPPEDAAAGLARHLRIDHLLERPVTALSVGQQQRVAAARALIGAPELVIADEPTSALDADHRRAFLELLTAEAARTGAGVLFVSHDHGLAGMFGRIVALREINAPPGAPLPAAGT